MKVVISTCYGGFGLSPEAERKLVELKDPHVKLLSFMEYTGNRYATVEEARRETVEKFPTLAPLVIDEKVVVDEHRSSYHFKDFKTMEKEDTHARDCPLLVKVVEEMGEKANSKYADLTVVEIPDGVQYDIDEYDGFESIHEKHRHWP